MKPIAVLLSLSLLLGTAALPAMAAETTEETVMTYPSDAVAWEELEERIRGGSLQARALRESEARIDSINYTLLYEDLRKQLNNLASYQWALCQMGNSAGADNLQKSYDALRDTFDDLKDGKVQKDNGDVVRQLENGVDQVVIAGEGLYLTFCPWRTRWPMESGASPPWIEVWRRPGCGKNWARFRLRLCMIWSGSGRTPWSGWKR